MTSLGRSLSFTRRRKGPSRPAFSPEKERPQKTKEAENVPSQEAAEDAAAPTRMQKIIRSASFGRRGSKAKGNAKEIKKDDPPTAEEESTSGDRKSVV